MASAVGHDGAPRSIVDAVAEQVRLRPHDPAVVAPTATLSYHTLQALADRQAAALRRAGVRRGDVVGLQVDPSRPEALAVQLAVLTTGAAYLCIDGRAPETRAERMLAAAGAVLTVTDGAGHPDRPAACVELAALGRPGGWTADAAGAQAPAEPHDLAYVAFTSGSTGAPRGVAVPHRAVMRLVRDPGFATPGPRDVVGAFSSPAFDASTFEIWGALANGATLVLPPSARPTVPELLDTVRRCGVTVLWLTAGLFHQIVDAGELASCPSLRHVLTGGDVVSPQRVDESLRQRPGLLVTNGYGPTENTTFTTTFSTREPVDAPSTPIGRPLHGTGVHVLDDALEPVPAGAVGELFVTGTGLAHGYLGRSAATAERFLPHPRPACPGERMYRTGDRVRTAADGGLEFLGRTDNQVKVRGFRVETDEVTAALESLRYVAAAAVFRHETGPGGGTLAAAVRLAEDVADPSSTLRGHLLRTLPDYAVPSVVIVVDELPLTLNNKIDVDVLRGLLLSRHRGLSTGYTPPEDDLQETVVEVWGTRIRTGAVGVDDDFFEIGGHSLLAVAIIADLRARTGVEISAREFYVDPTPRGMATTIAAKAGPPC